MRSISNCFTRPIWRLATRSPSITTRRAAPARPFYRRLRARLTQRAALERRLEAVQGDGASLRTHLTRAHAATHQADPLLAESLQPLPVALQPLWHAFVQLNDSRNGESGIAPTEIEAYGRLHGVCFNPWEAETLMAIDRAWRSAGAEQQQRKGTN